MKKLLEYHSFLYCLPLHTGVVDVYKQPHETLLQTATIQLRNKLKMQLPLGYDHFTYIGSGYREIY